MHFGLTSIVYICRIEKEEWISDPGISIVSKNDFAAFRRKERKTNQSSLSSDHGTTESFGRRISKSMSAPHPSRMNVANPCRAFHSLIVYEEELVVFGGRVRYDFRTLMNTSYQSLDYTYLGSPWSLFQ